LLIKGQWKALAELGLITIKNQNNEQQHKKIIPLDESIVGYTAQQAQQDTL
jgi:hypothetical protein